MISKENRSSILVAIFALCLCLILIFIEIGTLNHKNKVRSTFSNSENYTVKDAVVEEVVKTSKNIRNAPNSVTYYLIVEANGIKYSLKDNTFKKLPDIEVGDSIKIKISENLAIIDGAEPTLDENFSKFSLFVFGIISLGILVYLYRELKVKGK